MTMLGAYTGNDPADVQRFESWLGRQVDFVRAHTGRASWADWEGSIGWVAGQFAHLGKPLFWNIPLFANQGSLAEAAAGDYDALYAKAARTIVDARPADEIIYVRMGEEFNGEWMPWAARGREADFVQAYRHFVDAFRSVSDRFRFEWNVNTDRDWDPSLAYPGDGYVDVIGMDFYYNTEWHPKDPVAAWDHMLNQRYGLAWLEAFAASRGKPTAYSEWGVNSPDAAPFIARVSEWFDSHNVLYQSYWNSNSDFRGKLSDGELPGTGAAYLSEFSGAAPSGLNLTGTAWNDTLLGSRGNDTMSGSWGDDTYLVDSSADIVVELRGQGTDTVLSSASSFRLSAEVENLVLLKGASNGIGNASANRISGNAGDNALSGRGGNDVLTGGGGKDTFLFDTRPSRTGNVDRITDFSVRDDSIHLDNGVFTKLGRKGTPSSPSKLDPKMFWKGAKAHDATDRLVYDAKTGAVYYDADGTGKAAQVKFAQLKPGLALTHKDFFVI